MGGKAFASGPDALLTPRMPQPIYRSLLNQHLALLANLFDHVASPIEAPEKDSFGDIDIIVSQPKVTPFFRSTSSARSMPNGSFPQIRCTLSQSLTLDSTEAMSSSTSKSVSSKTLNGRSSTRHTVTCGTCSDRALGHSGSWPTTKGCIYGSRR